jgi:hypothetical protein
VCSSDLGLRVNRTENTVLQFCGSVFTAKLLSNGFIPQNTLEINVSVKQLHYKCWEVHTHICAA